ncbi:MAG: insulinase family protein [Chitinophagaceae bacterium]
MRKALLAISICLFLLSAKNIQAQSAPKLITTVEGIKEFELSNGLRVLLIPDASQTNVLVNIVYKVGSRHEGYGESGMAHLLEHMLFQDCEKFTDIKKAIADRGASANGTTYYDRTNYYEILSGSDDNLKWALDMESDRMVNSKIYPEELKKEFSVVRNEFEIGENYPSSVLTERILSSMYLWHNYGKSTIGSKEDIERVKAENLKVFYKKYYQPDNAVLIIAGKFDETKALAYTQEFFGPIPKPTRVLQPTYTVEPAQDGERNVELRRVGDIQYVAMGYHTPSMADKDYAANDALMEVLINDPSGVFYKKLVETKLATKVYGYTSTSYDPGFSYFEIEVPKDKNLDSAKHTLLSAADAIPVMNITEEDLTRAKNTKIKFLENIMSKTIDLGITMTEIIGAGDWRLLFWYRDQVEKLTVKDLQDVARKYYKTSNRTYGTFIPDTKTPERTVVNETPDIAKLLDGYKGKEVAAKKADFESSIPNIKKNTEYGKLSNGGKYALLEKPTKGDKVTASLSLRMGDENSLMNKTELGGIVFRMLKSGTTTKSKKQISDELDRLKTDISFNGSPGAVVITLNTDKQNLPAALNLLDDLLHHPKFDQAEFEKVIMDRKADLQASKNEPFTISSEKLSKLSSRYPKGHPFYASDVDEKMEDLDKIKLEDVKKYYADFYGANNSLAAFVGEMDKKQVVTFLQNSFGKWDSKISYKPVEPKYFDIPATTATVKTPDKTNAAMLTNINVKISEKSPEFPAMYIANELLGGGAFLSSRIPKRLREDEGMSYGAGSFMNTQYKYDVGNWGVYAAYNPLYKGRIDSAFHEEITKALTSGFTPDELKKTVDAWLEQNRTSLGENSYVADMLRRYMRDERVLDDFTSFETKVKGLDLNAVNAALRKYFDQSKLITVYSGDFDKGKPVTETEKKAF